MTRLSTTRRHLHRRKVCTFGVVSVVFSLGVVAVHRNVSYFTLMPDDAFVGGQEFDWKTLPPPLFLSDSSTFESPVSSEHGHSNSNNGNGNSVMLTCADDYQGNKAVLDSIKVFSSSTSASSTLRTPRILCFVMTHSESHLTKVRAVLDTWGKRCDRLVVASNVTDFELGTIALKTPATYELLWDRLNETLHFIWEKYQHENHDWYLKADDDSYVIMENLLHFVSEKEPQKSAVKDGVHSQPPLIFGYPLPTNRWGDISKLYFQGSPENRAFGHIFFNYTDSSGQKKRPEDPADYLHGGAGYVMNRQYVQEFLHALKGTMTLRTSYNEKEKTLNHPPLPEDLAHGVTMMVHGVQPNSAMDSMRRPLFLPEPPNLMHHIHQQKIQDGSARQKSLCCSRSAISFHHVSHTLMRYLDHQLYTCRQNWDII